MKTKKQNWDMIEQIQMVPSVLVKARFKGATIGGTTFEGVDFFTWVNINSITMDHYEIAEPRQYRVHYTPSNTEIIPM